MKRISISIIIIVLLSVFVIPVSASDTASYYGYPYFFIASVTTDKTVTINAYNFPANDNFTVTMGAMGTKGVGGIVVATTEACIKSA